MILTNNEIIDLYHESKFDTIINNLKLDPRWKDIHYINEHTIPSLSTNMEYSYLESRCQYGWIILKLGMDCQIVYESDVEYILAYAISTSNIELVEHLFTAENINPYSVVNMIRLSKNI